MADAIQAVSGTVAAAGTARLSLRPTNRRTWTIKQVTANAPNVGAAATAKITVNGAVISGLVATNGTAAGEPYIPLLPGSTMNVDWSGATAGAGVEVTFVYDDGT